MIATAVIAEDSPCGALVSDIFKLEYPFYDGDSLVKLHSARDKTLCYEVKRDGKNYYNRP